MAYITETVGVYSELIAEAALMASGYVGVARPTTNEYYDLIATDRITGKDTKFQVKTLKRRDYKGGDWINLIAKNGQGKSYGADNASDYYIGVLVDDGETPRVFAVENEDPNQQEYWVKNHEVAEKWTELPLALDRVMLEEMAVASTAKEIDEEFRKAGV